MGCLAIDVGAGSGLLSLMLARQVRAHCPGTDPGFILGAEVLRSVAEIAAWVIADNGMSDMVRILRTDAAQLCSHARNPDFDARAAVMVAELMDTGGLGEGLLPLAASACASGLLLPGAQMIPSRLRVWALLVELRGCGTALDGAEILPSFVGGVCLEPWLRYRHLKQGQRGPEPATPRGAANPIPGEALGRRWGGVGEAQGRRGALTITSHIKGRTVAGGFPCNDTARAWGVGGVGRIRGSRARIPH